MQTDPSSGLLLISRGGDGDQDFAGIETTTYMRPIDENNESTIIADLEERSNSYGGTKGVNPEYFSCVSCKAVRPLAFGFDSDRSLGRTEIYPMVRIVIEETFIGYYMISERIYILIYN